MTSDQLIDMMIQGIEAKEPHAVLGRLNPGAVGFRVQINGDLYAVRVEQLRSFWDADMIDEDTGAGMFDDADQP